MGGVTKPLKKQSHPAFDMSYMAFFSKKCGVTAIKRKTDTNYLTLLYHSGKVLSYTYSFRKVYVRLKKEPQGFWHSSLPSCQMKHERFYWKEDQNKEQIEFA